MTTDLAKELYFRELDRRHQLDSAPTFQVGMLALLGGVFSYYFQAFPATSRGLIGIFLVCTTGATIAATLSIIWIIRSYLGYTWAYLPYPQQLLDTYRALRVYDREHGLEHGGPDAVFDTDLCEHLVAAATANATNNNSRSEFIYAAGRFLAIAVAFSLVAGIPVAIHALRLIPIE